MSDPNQSSPDEQDDVIKGKVDNGGKPTDHSPDEQNKNLYAEKIRKEKGDPPKKKGYTANGGKPGEGSQDLDDL